MSGEIEPAAVTLEDEIYKKTALYTVGFLVLSKDEQGRGAFLPRGSGVLADIGGVRGIVTAAHVASEIKKFPQAALFTIVNRKRSRPLRFESDELDYVSAGPASDPSNGPDLAFVQVPQRVLEHLLAENAFYNFAIRFNEAEGPTPAVVAHLLAGVLAERTEFKEIVDGARIDTHTMVLAGGIVGNERNIGGGFDTFDFRVSHNEAVSRPNTYGGLSGSAIWKTEPDGEKPERVIFGIVFYETEPNEQGVRTIKCNGAAAIYVRLIDLVANAFPRQFREFRPDHLRGN